MFNITSSSGGFSLGNTGGQGNGFSLGTSNKSMQETEIQKVLDRFKQKTGYNLNDFELPTRYNKDKEQFKKEVE